MAKKDMKSALKGSLIKEEQAIKDRFEKAETLLSKEKEHIPQNEKNVIKPQITQELKVIRDSFTMPQVDYELITLLKKRSINLGVEITKSEILRAGLKALELMPVEEFLSKIALVEKIKTGRPKQIS
jgi:hypothetical protein